MESTGIFIVAVQNFVYLFPTRSLLTCAFRMLNEIAFYTPSYRLDILCAD